MCRYGTMCRYTGVCVGIELILIYKCLPIPTGTYTYMQYLHIMTYLYIPAIPTHTINTYTYRHTCTHPQYLHIHAIPTNTDMPNIPVIPTNTYNTYT